MLLLNDNLTIVDVALTVGFQTQAHFTTVFKRFVGSTPRRWRTAGGRPSPHADEDQSSADNDGAAEAPDPQPNRVVWISPARHRNMAHIADIHGAKLWAMATVHETTTRLDNIWRG